MLKIQNEEIVGVLGDKCDVGNDINKGSVELYSELQKDLSKLVLSEMQKDNRDNNVVLNSIRLQAELQEKKIMLGKGISRGAGKIAKHYIYERDKQIAALKERGVTPAEIAKEFGVSIFSVNLALDREELGLSEELRELPPTIISETIGLPKESRMLIIKEAADKKLTRREVREMCVAAKNVMRNG